jgi:hypothetical protein
MTPMMGMMGMADHIEGRIAFLKAELKITDTQLTQWNEFADVLRANARNTTAELQQHLGLQRRRTTQPW